MALLFMDSFDHYLTADILSKWSSSVVSGIGGSISIGTLGRRGSGAFRWTTGTSSGIQGSVTRILSSSDATVIVGFAINISASGTPSVPPAILQIKDSGGNTHLSVTLNNSMGLTVYRNTPTGGGTILGSTSVGLTVGSYSYVEFKGLISDTVGTIDIRINGASALSLTGQDTKTGAIAGWNSVILGQSEVGTGTGSINRTIDYDDLYVSDSTGAAPWNNFLGDCRVDVRVPTGAGATTGWTPSTGANWQNVDDATPNGDTDYNLAAAAGVTDTFVVQDSPVVGATIFGVQHCINTKKSDAGAVSLAPVIRHSGTDNVGANLSPGTSYGYLLQINQVNPGTSTAWTEAGFNAAEFGYKRTV